MSLLVFAYNFYLFIYLFILGLKRDEGEICGHQLGHVSIISYLFFFFFFFEKPIQKRTVFILESEHFGSMYRSNHYDEFLVFRFFILLNDFFYQQFRFVFYTVFYKKKFFDLK